MQHLTVYRRETPRNRILIVDFSRFLLSLLFLITVWLFYSLFDEYSLFDNDVLRKVFIYSITTRMLYSLLFTILLAVISVFDYFKAAFIMNMLFFFIFPLEININSIWIDIIGYFENENVLNEGVFVNYYVELMVIVVFFVMINSIIFNAKKNFYA